MNMKRLVLILLVSVNTLLIGFVLWSMIPMLSSRLGWNTSDVAALNTLERFANLVDGSDLERVRRKIGIKSRKRQEAIESKKTNDNEETFTLNDEMKEQRERLEADMKRLKERMENGEQEDEDEDEGEEQERQREERPLSDFELMNLQQIDTADEDVNTLFFLVLPAGGLIDTERDRLRSNAKIIGSSLNKIAKVLGETLSLRNDLEEKRGQLDRIKIYINTIIGKSDEAVVFSDSLLKTASSLGVIEGGTKNVEKYGKSIDSMIKRAVRKRDKNALEDANDMIEFFAESLTDHPSIAPLTKKTESMKKKLVEIIDENQEFGERWKTSSDGKLKIPEWCETIENVKKMRKRVFGPLIDLLLDVENFYETDLDVLKDRYEIDGLDKAIQNFTPTPFQTPTLLSADDSLVRVDDFNALRDLVVRAVMIVHKLKKETEKIKEQVEKTLEIYKKYKESVETISERIKDAETQLTGQDNAVDQLSKVIGSNKNLKIARKVDDLRDTQIEMMIEIERLESIPFLFTGDSEDEEEVEVEVEVEVEDEVDEEVEVEVEDEVDEEEEDEIIQGNRAFGEVEDEVEEEELDRNAEFKMLLSLNEKSVNLSQEISEDYAELHRRSKDVKNFGDAFNDTMKKLLEEWDTDFLAHLIDSQSEVNILADMFDVYEDKVLNSYDGCGITIISIEEFLGNSKGDMLKRYEDDELLSIYIEIMAVDGDEVEPSIQEVDQKVNFLAVEVYDMIDMDE